MANIMNNCQGRLSMIATILAAVFADGASAKTVALWPLEYDETRRAWNPYGQLNAVDGSYPLYFYVVNTSDAKTANESIGWELPPNPDPSVPLERARNGRTPGGLSADGNVPMLLNKDFGGEYLTRLNDYTVEVYFKLLDLPAKGGFYYLFGGLSKEKSSSVSDDNNRWMVTLRHNKNNDTFYWNFYSAGGGVGDKTLATLTSDEIVALTNSWHHMAFTHAAKAVTSEKEEWALYFDGQQVGSTVTSTPLTSIAPLKDRNFEVGGRFGGNRSSGLFDYIRVSDTVLKPSEFLCAGGTPTVSTVSPTVAYWKFDVAADGQPDLSPSLGKAYLHALVGLGDVTNSQYSVSRPRRDDKAFSGLPPNTLMEPTPTRTLVDNTGCIWNNSATHSYIHIPHLGNELTPTNSFTVEGWFKPETSDIAAEANKTLFSIRDKTTLGWSLFYTKDVAFGSSNAWGFYISFCCDGRSVDNLYFKNAPDLVDWATWKHVALVYDATTATGTWTLYLDGRKFGTVDNLVKPVYAKPPDWSFLIGGRTNDKIHSWCGGIDCVRVTKVALRPTQLLCATTDKEKATDVISLWPLDVYDGIFFEGHDAMNRYHADTTWLDRYPGTDAKYRLGCHIDDSPTISNPDRTPWFRGDSASKNGSIQFWDAVNSGTTAGRCSYVATRDPTVIDAIHARKPLTVEMYVKRTCDASDCGADQWENLFALYGTFSVYDAFKDPALIVNYHPINGFQVNDKYWMSTTGDRKFNADGANEPKNVWRHYAFVRTFDDEAGTVNWSLYINGVLSGSTNCQARAKMNTVSNAENFMIGGRGYGGITAFKGRIGTVRISQAALDPKDFLCGTPSEPPEEPSTVAYWRADSTASGLDFSNRVDAAYGLTAVGVSGQSERARAHVPNPDATPGFDGSPRLNVGSLVMSEGGMYAAGAAQYASTLRPFTAEGWVRNPSGPLVGTWDVQTCGGWQLSAAGNGRFTLRGRGNFRTTYYVDGAFEAGALDWQNAWHHVALVYDPQLGEAGVWVLYVDGKPFGSVANFWRPTSELPLTAPHNFTVGGTFDGRSDGIGTSPQRLEVPFSGQVDMWRLSRKALAPEEFLYRDPAGFLLSIQ